MGDFWKQTAEMFTALIEKPKMVQKHLVKPPFKYIVDIITSTTKKTNFGNGLFTEQEQVGDYYLDKEKKITYLSKVIRLVELMSGATIEAKPQKIIAGLEPEYTNELLQHVYRCATSGKSSDPFVKRIMGGQEEEPPKKEVKPEVKEVKADPANSKMPRPPSAARIKKPTEVAPPVAPSVTTHKKVVEEEPPAPPPPKVEQREPQRPAAKQQYSSKVKQLMQEGEAETVAQQETEKEEMKNKKEINLGKLGGKKRKETSQKVISSTGELTEKQLEMVQTMIQSICQNTAPLGKSIEFINDDVEAMNKELAHWRKQYNSSKAKTQNELKITEETLLPVYDKIAEIEEQILGQRSKIQTAKSQIIKNAHLVKDLLMSVMTTR